MKLSTRIQNRIEYVLFRLAIAILGLLPYSVAKRILVSLFLLIGYYGGIRRKVALTQLGKVFPDLSHTDKRRIAKEHYRIMALNAAEEFLLDPDEMLARCSVSGMEHVRAAFEIGNGFILATAHYGNWEAARIMPCFDIPTSVITKRQRNRLFDDYTNRVRGLRGVRVIDMKKGLRGILEELRHNHMVAILADQNAGKSGLIFDFMGYPASHWLGVAKLSLRYKVPIVPGFAVRTEDEKTVFTFEPMIYHPDWEDKEENYEAILREIDQILADYIRRDPKQWFWVHKRWKSAYNMFS